jgi:hypothetical protein
MHNRIGCVLICMASAIAQNTYAYLVNTGTADQNQDTTKTGFVHEEVRKYTAVRLSTDKPIIDGVLNDACWMTGTWDGDFTQWIPNEGAKPTYPTVLKILYDDKNIYVAIRAYDKEPDKIQRYAGIRDELVGDQMGVNFDSYHDHRTGFEFDVSAYGQQIDLILSNPMDGDYSWNAVWKSKVGFEDSAWVVEMEIPLSQLRYSKEEEQVWGLHAWRWISRLQEESDYEKQSLSNAGMLYNFGELHGIKGLPASRRMEIMPYTSGRLNTYEADPANPFTKNGRDWDGKIGLDAKIGISSNFTVDMTLNPDFGQVELDPSVMNLTAFETFYDEKRPFFLEGKTIFNYDFDDIDLFYSRRIGQSPSYEIPQGGSYFVDAPENTTIIDALKLSGKTAGGLSVGFIQSLTSEENARLNDGLGNKHKIAVEPMANYSILRVQKDYNEGTTTIGGMLTTSNRFISDSHLEYLTRNAYTGGLDLLHQWQNKKYYVDARLVGSYVNGESQSITLLQESSARYYQRPGAGYLHYDTTRTDMKGSGGKFEIGKGSGQWRYNTSIKWLSPGLELNDLGYMQFSDQIDQENNLSYLVTQPVSIFRSYSMNLEETNSWNFNGNYLGSGVHYYFSSSFRNLWGFSINLIGNTQRLDTRILRGGPDMNLPGYFLTYGQINTDQSKRLSLEFAYTYQKSGQQSFRNYEWEPSITYRPVNSLKIKLSGDFYKNDDELQFVTSLPTTLGDRYILGTIDQDNLGFTLRIDYNITPDLSVQLYGSPFISRGAYSEFKFVTDPENQHYDQRFETYNSPVLSGKNYLIDENHDLIADYSIENPDFNFHQFRSNVVIKWRYRPGSYVYLVWSSERTGNAGTPDASMGKSFHELWNVFPGNIFLIKFNYWFSI